MKLKHTIMVQHNLSEKQVGEKYVFSKCMASGMFNVSMKRGSVHGKNAIQKDIWRGITVGSRKVSFANLN